MGCEADHVSVSSEWTSMGVEKAMPTSDSQEPKENDGTRAVNKPVLSSNNDELQKTVRSSDLVEDDANMVAFSKPTYD